MEELQRAYTADRMVATSPETESNPLTNRVRGLVAIQKKCSLDDKTQRTIDPDHGGLKISDWLGAMKKMSSWRLAAAAEHPAAGMMKLVVLRANRPVYNCLKDSK